MKKILIILLFIVGCKQYADIQVVEKQLTLSSIRDTDKGGDRFVWLEWQDSDGTSYFQLVPYPTTFKVGDKNTFLIQR